RRVRRRPSIGARSGGRAGRARRPSIALFDLWRHGGEAPHRATAGASRGGWRSVYLRCAALVGERRGRTVGYNVRAYAVDLERLRALVGSSDEAFIGALCDKYDRDLTGIDEIDASAPS